MLFLDVEDKDQFLAILVDALEEFYSKMFAFELLDTHYHYFFGLKHESRNLPDASWLDDRVRKFVAVVNRRYGRYYRQKYGFQGDLFKKYDYCAKRAFHQNDFHSMMSYVHMNGLAARKFAAIEDDPYNSFAYYMSAFFQNPEFQQLPTVQRIDSAPSTIKIFDMLDLEHAVKQYDSDFQLGALGLAKHMKNAQRRFRDAPSRHEELGLAQFYNQPERIRFEKTDGHRVKRFISALKGNPSELRLENSIGNSELFLYADSNPALFFEEFLQLFNAPFAVGDKASMQAAFQSLRKNFETQYNEFVCAMSGRVSQNKICDMIGLNKYSFRSIVG